MLKACVTLELCAILELRNTLLATELIQMKMCMVRQQTPLDLTI